MAHDSSRSQEQQAPRAGNRQQQQSASSPEFQRQSGSSQQADKPEAGTQQMGEGSYEGTRDYQDRMKNYLDKADVKKDAEAAKPESKEEADELRKAEDAGLSHTRAPGQ